MWVVSFTPLSLYSQENSAQYLLYKRLMSTRADVDVNEGRKISYLFRESNLNSLVVQPVASSLIDWDNHSISYKFCYNFGSFSSIRYLAANKIVRTSSPIGSTNTFMHKTHEFDSLHKKETMRRRGVSIKFSVLTQKWWNQTQAWNGYRKWRIWVKKEDKKEIIPRLFQLADHLVFFNGSLQLYKGLPRWVRRLSL
jgi:hypothetical protein